MPRHDKERKCHPEAKRLCDLARCVGEHSYHKKKNATLVSGSVINEYLLSLGSGYGTERRQGISIDANALKDDQDYLIWYVTVSKKYG